MEHPSFHHHVLLLVDDDDDFRAALTTALELAGYVVASADSAVAALDQMTAGLRPCLLLLDIQMADETGWGLWERMRIDPVLLKPIDARQIAPLLAEHCSAVPVAS